MPMAKIKGDNLYVKHTEMVLQLFYNRFNKEYMLELLERHSFGTKQNSSNQPGQTENRGNCYYQRQ